MGTCKTCELIASRDAGTAPFWDSFHRTPYWDTVHNNNTTLPGWLVLFARRHVTAIDELSDEEAAELGLLVRRASVALKEVTGCVKTYIIQFAEHPDHPHVHFHIIPRMADMPEERRSTNVFGYIPTPDEEWVSELVMNDIAVKVKPFLVVPAP